MLFVVPLLAVLLIGAGAGRGLAVAPRASLATRFGWSFVLGAAVLGTVGVLGSLFAGLPLGLPTVVVSILLTAPGFLRSRKRPSVPEVPWWVAVPLALAAIALVAEAVAFPVRDFDGRMTWVPAAQYMRAERTVLAKPIVSAEVWVTHPQYPPLLPALRATALLLAGTEDERASRPLDALFLPAALLVLFGALRGLAGPRGAGIAVLLALLTPALSTENHGGAAGTYADVPMGVFVFSGFLILLRARSASAGVAGGLLLLAGVLSKNEALPIVLCGLVLVAMLRRKRIRALAPAGLFVLVGVLALVRWHQAVPNRFDEDYGKALRAATPARVYENLRNALPAVARATVDPGSWGMSLGALAALAVFELRRTRKALVLMLLALLPLLAGLAAYAVTPWGVGELVPVTWPRFLNQAFLPLFAVTAMVAGSFLKKLWPASRRNAA